MATIAQPRCHCNKEIPEFSGISETASARAPYWPGRRALQALLRTPPSAADITLTAGCRQLLDAIRTRLPHGQDSAALRQQELAAALPVTSVTIRRCTSQLQQQGLLLVRRTRNRLVYTIPTTTHRPTPAGAPAPTELPAAPAPTAAPPAGAATPCCPKHRLPRRSWMSKLLSAALHFCPARTGIDTLCSWLHHSTLGQLQPPYQAELDYDAVRAKLQDPTPADTPPLPNPEPAPSPHPAADAAQQVWRAATDELRKRTPDDIRPYIAASRATGYDGSTLSVETATPAVLRWFRTSFTASAFPKVLAQMLGHPAVIRYHCARASS